MKRSTTIRIVAALCFVLTTTVSFAKGDSSEVDHARRALADAERRVADAQRDLKLANDRLRSVRVSIEDAQRRQRRSQEIFSRIERSDAEFAAPMAAAERDRMDASAQLRDADSQLAAAESAIARAKQSLDSRHATAFGQFANSSTEYRSADGLLRSKDVLLRAAHDAVVKRLAANDQTYAELSDKIKKLEAGSEHMIKAGASEARIEERRAEIAQANEQRARYVDDQCAADPMFAAVKADFDQANARRQGLIDAFEADFAARPETIASLRELDQATASRDGAIAARDSAASLLASAEERLSYISSQRSSIERDRYEAQQIVVRTRTECDAFDREFAAANADIRRATDCVADAQRDRDRAAQELASAMQQAQPGDSRRDPPPPAGSTIDNDAARRKQADDRERAIREADARNRDEDARRQQQQQQDANRQDDAKRQAEAKRDEQQKRQEDAKRQQAEAEQRRRDAEEKAKADQQSKADRDREQQQKRHDEAIERQKQQEEARKRQEEAAKKAGGNGGTGK